MGRGANLSAKELKELADFPNVSGVTPICVAARSNHFRMVKDLVRKAKADVNAASFAGSTALFEACRVGNLVLAKFLHSSGADMYHRDRVGRTTLWASASAGHLDVCRWLLKLCEESKGRDEVDDFRETKAADGSWPLSIARSKGHKEVVKFLEGLENVQRQRQKRATDAAMHQEKQRKAEADARKTHDAKLRAEAEIKEKERKRKEKLERDRLLKARDRRKKQQETFAEQMKTSPVKWQKDSQ